MKILIDTCTILFCELNPKVLSEKVKKLLTSPKSEIFFSAISVAEIACGYQKRFKLKEHWRPWLTGVIRENGWNIIPIDYDMMVEAYSLPEPFHRDPADRVIVATARIHRMDLLTNDRLIRGYPHVGTVW